jgi:hypothetical protein
MKKILSATCMLLACHAVHAGDAAPVVDTTSAQTPAITATTKSTFTGSGGQHNPFWPIGWVKTSEAETDDSTTAVSQPRADDFTVSTIMLNEPRLAVINGKDMAEGEVAQMTTNGGETVTVQLMAVQDGSVVLRWENQAIVVQIHRDEDLTQASPSPGN